jgi:hypothetical protein
LVRPELPTASVGSSQATTAAVDNSAPVQPARGLFISWGKTVQTSGATSIGLVKLMHAIAGLKFSPMSIERIENWASFGFIEKFQVCFLILVLLTLSSGMGWVIGGLVSLAWRA